MSFEGYSEEFQRNVLQLMFADPAFLTMVSEAVRPDHFDSAIHAVYAEIFLQFSRKYPADRITKEVIFREIKKLISMKKIKEEEKPQFVKEFPLVVQPPAAAGYIRDEIRDFVAGKTLELALIEGVDLLKKKRYAELVDEINGTFAKLDAGDKVADFSVIGGIDDRIERYSAPEFAERKDGVRTSVEGCDAAMYRRGYGKKEMLVFCGSPGRGKSICLVNTAIIACLNGLNGLFYTLEVSEEIVHARIDACVTGVPFIELGRFANIVRKRWAAVKDHYGGRIGELKLMDLPPRYLTPNMIRRHIRWYKARGFEIDYICVDYADIMASDRRIDDRRLEYGDVYEQIRGIGKEFNIAMCTASQANRDSLRKRDVDIDSMAEDFSKAMTADYVIGLSQDKREAEEKAPDGRGTGKLRWFIAKNRNGKKGESIEMMTDFTRMRASVADWDRFDAEVYGAPSHRLPMR
jgi:replicative DNA helicase